MIGREGPVKPFELIRWARSQAQVHGLKQLDAHVLLVLATYANEECEAWPSLHTLAVNCGLKPKVPEPGKPGTNSAISAALRRLEECQLIWTKQGGRGSSAKRELLFNPSALTEGNGSQPSTDPEGKPPKPSGHTEGNGEADCGLPSALTEPAFRADGTEVPEKGQGTAELPNSNNGQMKPSAVAEGFPSRFAEGWNDPSSEPSRAEVRLAIVEQFGEAAA